MTTIDAAGLDHRSLNEKLRQTDGDVTVSGCLGQRFIAAGMGKKSIELLGTPGNALGAYLNGAEITVRGSAQDASGDTMNDGRIIVHGDIGDAAGYAMRGGEIYVKGNAGYRAGIHMKEYGAKRPVMIIGGRCGSFLGEYQSGGVIIVLGLNQDGRDIVGDFPCTGMHGGRMLLRSKCESIRFPENVLAASLNTEELAEFDGYIESYCGLFGVDKSVVMNAPFTLISPRSRDPYRQMYVAN